MRNKTTILLALLVLGAIWAVRNPPRSTQPQAATPETNETPRLVMPSAAPFAQEESTLSRIPVFARPLPELPGNTGSDETLRERIVKKQLPKLLADKEGSYTNLNEVLRSNRAPSVDLRSDWATRYLFRDHNLPNLRVRISKSPETGEYEPVGGALTLPGFSLEAGYEVDPGTDDYKATLHWKKSF